MRLVALLVLFAFGCATVRVPVTAAEEPADAAGTIATPITELWLESSEEVPAAVARAAERDTRDALDSALRRHEIPATAAGASDAVLFVRERAVGLTSERKSQQRWAKVGVVVGFVVVLAAAVYLAAKGSGGKRSSSSQAKSASAPKSAAPVAVKPQAAPAPAPPPRAPTVGHAVPVPPPYAYGPSSPVYIGFWFQFTIPPRPLVLAPEVAENDPWGMPEPPVPYAPLDEPFEEPPDLSGPPPPPEPIEAVALQLPPLADAVRFPLEDRGFFSPPQTALQLDLIDRATGRLLWSRAVSAEVDPLDAGDVAELVDGAFAGVSWARRRP